MKSHKWIAVVFILILLLAGCTKQTVQATTGVTVSTDQTTESADAPKIEEALSQFTFYRGLATVMEDQQWTSKGTDGSHGEGDGVLTSEDYLVYDESTQKLYIVARNMTYTSKHIVTINDMNGKYLNTANVSATGELQEFYSWGFTLDGKPNFSSLPVRADQASQSVFTRPETLNQQWVAYTSTADTVRLGVDRVMPPETSVNPALSELPSLDQLVDNKSYGNKDTYVYEATTRFWNLKGTFDYRYDKITLEEMMKGVKEIQEAQASDESFSKRVENLPEVWQVTATMGDQLNDLAIAGAQIAAGAKGAEGALASDGNNAEGILKALLEQPEFSEARNKLKDLGEAQGDQAAPRRLEGVVIESGDSNLKESYNPFLKAYAVIMTAYAEKAEQFQEAFQAFEAQKSAESLKAMAQAAKALGGEGLTLVAPLEIFEDKIQEALKGDALGQLDGLYKQFAATVADSIGKETAVDIEGSVALPKGYPVELVPLMPGARVIITEIIPAEGDLREGYSVSCVVQADENAITAYYTDVLSGLASFEVTSLGTMKVLTAINDLFSINVLITPNTLGGEEPMMVQITLTDASD